MVTPLPLGPLDGPGARTAGRLGERDLHKGEGYGNRPTGSQVPPAAGR